MSAHERDKKNIYISFPENSMKLLMTNDNIFFSLYENDENYVEKKKRYE